MADIEASVRDLVNRGRDCTERAQAQMDLRRKINLLIGDVLPDIRDRVRSRSLKSEIKPIRVVARR